MPRVDRSSPALVALTALLLYAAWVGWAHHIGHDWQDWAAIGRRFVGASETSPRSRAMRRTRRAGSGTTASSSSTSPATRPAPSRTSTIRATATAGSSTRSRSDSRSDVKRRFRLPLSSSTCSPSPLAPGQSPNGCAAALPGVVRAPLRGVSGVFFGVWRDLSEPLAYALTAVALLAFDGERPRRLALSASLFAVAILTGREPVFALVWAAALASRVGACVRRFRDRLAPALSRIPVRVPEPVARERRAPGEAAADAGAIRRDRPLLPVGRRRAAARLRRALTRMLLRRARRRRARPGQEAPPFGRCSRTRSSSWCSCRPPPTRTTRRQAGSRRASSLRSCCRCRP